MTIKQQLITGFLAVALIPILFIGVISFSNAKSELEQAQITAIETILDLQFDQLEAFFRERKGNIRAAQDNFNIKANLPTLTRFANDQTDSKYIAAKRMLDGQLKTFQTVFGYFDVMLVNPEGKIVYVTNEAHSTKDLGNMLPDPDNIAFIEGKKEIYFSVPFLNKVENDRPSMIITAPVHNFAGTFIGVIALEVDMTPIYKFLQNRMGLGKTGEALIGRKIGERVLFLSPLRHHQEAILQEMVTLGDETAFPIQEAVQGRDGKGLSRDYRDEDVIAGWRHLPSVNWGMVAKIDKEEAFLPIKRLQMLLIILSICTLFLGGGVAFFISKSISKPIRTLQKGMEQVGKGHLGFKVGTDSQDEIGQLSRSFDQMVGDLKTLNLTLEKRADELARSNEDLEQFTSIASHDLQEPLRKMRSFSSILKEDYRGVLDEDGV
ncbi:MAG: cache domain-containing protein, partial [Nitrospiria bacterium]